MTSSSHHHSSPPPSPLALPPLPPLTVSASPNYSTTVFICILFIYVLLGFSLEARKKAGQYLWLHESGPAVLMGAVLGLAVMHTSGGNNRLEISDQTFFYFVLPPIIFAQGYGLKKRNFFKYFHYITAFGVFGTFLQFVFMTGSLFQLSSIFKVQLNTSEDEGAQLTLQEAMIISACLAAADEVAALSLIKSTEYPKLSAILFGEGVVNDAISILLFHAVVTTKRLESTAENVVTVLQDRRLQDRRAEALTTSTTADDDDTATADDDDGLDDPYVHMTPSPSPFSSLDDHDHHHQRHIHHATFAPTLSPTSLPVPHSIPALMNYWDIKIYDILSSTFKTLLMAILVGVGSGLIIARVMKVYPEMQKSPVHQTALFALGAYISFCISDALSYSGVLTVFFSGLTLSHYAYHSLSDEAKKSTKVRIVSNRTTD
jgi:NhaP-type Na+/H+ or K+/H+ antiporter